VYLVAILHTAAAEIRTSFSTLVYCQPFNRSTMTMKIHTLLTWYRYRSYLCDGHLAWWMAQHCWQQSSSSSLSSSIAAVPPGDNTPSALLLLANDQTIMVHSAAAWMAITARGIAPWFASLANAFHRSSTMAMISWRGCCDMQRVFLLSWFNIGSSSGGDG